MSNLEGQLGDMSLDYLTYSLGDFKLKNGGAIPDARIGQYTAAKLAYM